MNAFHWFFIFVKWTKKYINNTNLNELIKTFLKKVQPNLV